MSAPKSPRYARIILRRALLALETPLRGGVLSTRAQGKVQGWHFGLRKRSAIHRLHQSSFIGGATLLSRRRPATTPPLPVAAISVVLLPESSTPSTVAAATRVSRIPLVATGDRRCGSISIFSLTPFPPPHSRPRRFRGRLRLPPLSRKSVPDGHRRSRSRLRGRLALPPREYSVGDNVVPGPENLDVPLVGRAVESPLLVNGGGALVLADVVLVGLAAPRAL